ncbi:polysaccharide deacetylase family protein [Agromyces sp. NPDC056523]|uniref:polysaccharide deacetylase family protein n=1 Tax=Agromyces sp. NPDC056523 TaxID=3345850 RepID=UPI0036724935
MPRGREAAHSRASVVAAIAVLAPAIALTGCSPAGIAGPSPASEPDASSSASAAPEPTPAPLPVPQVVPGPPRLGPDRTGALVPRLAAMRTDTFAASARWATPPGVTEFGEALTARLEEALLAYVGERGVGWQPGVDLVAGGAAEACWGGSLTTPIAASLTVDCSIVVASGPLLGERLSLARREAGVAPSVVREVWYADAATGAVFGGAGLYAAGQESRVLALVAEGLRAGGRIEPGDDPFAGLGADAQRALLADSAVTPAGVVITTASAADAGRVASVHVPGRLLGPMLSEQGRTALAGAAAGGDYAPADAVVGDDPVDCSFVPCVSITFDDGPSSLTPGLLDLLDRERAPATFFVQGSAVQTSPDVAARIVASGHQIGNHTWRHPNLTKLEDDEVKKEISRTQQAIANATGAGATSMRPPYGASNAKVRDLVDLPVIVWDVDTRDWEDPGVDAVVDRAVTQSSRGSIVLMHDTHQETVDAVPAIIRGLRERGFALSTVAGQFGGALPGPGTLVSRGPR